MIQRRNPRGWRRGRVDWDELLLGALGSLWQCRLELLALLAGGAVHRLAARAGGEIVATVLVVVLAVGAVAVAPCRRLLWRAFRIASLRRAWERAAADAGLSDGPFCLPRMLGARSIPAGDVVRVQV